MPGQHRRWTHSAAPEKPAFQTNCFEVHRWSHQDRERKGLNHKSEGKLPAACRITGEGRAKRVRGRCFVALLRGALFLHGFIAPLLASSRKGSQNWMLCRLLSAAVMALRQSKKKGAEDCAPERMPGGILHAINDLYCLTLKFPSNPTA